MLNINGMIMSAQNKIILFCYLYIFGIVLAMLAPVDSVWLIWLQIAVAVAMIPAGIFFLWGLLRGTETPQKKQTSRVAFLVWTLLFSGSVLLGYSRYIRSNTVPDMRIGEIVISDSSRVFKQQVSLPDTSRLRLRKSGDLVGDVTIRLRGELDARVPVRDANGICTMDDQSRWVFQINRMPLESEIITVKADDPPGTDYMVNQPFTRITGIEWVDGPETGIIEVHRISNHIGSFVRPGRAQSPVTVLGNISSDTRVYDFKTVLIITPDYIQYPAGGPFYRVEGGEIQVTVQPSMDGYASFARTGAYGADVELKGELTVARAEANPGGFNARKFMQNYNIFGLMSLFQPRGATAPIHMVAPAGGAVRTGDPLVAMSLELRDRVLRIFKATMPYPQSAFLGGVTLGLRYGLQGTQFPGEVEENAVLTKLGLGRSEALIVDDFKASGVNHVLAVSGLHVTIITAMFVAIFGLLRMPRKVFVPFVILTLIVFAIITGARPSTLRAVIMNSLFLLTWAYLDKSLMSSVMLGVPVAAFVILLHNPLVVVDPSFTLSFGAILSLGLLTMPAHEILSRLRGNRFLAVILLSAATTIIGIYHWMLVVTPLFIIPWAVFCVVVYLLSGELEKRGLGISQKFAFTAIPESLSTFLAAQVAIQIGMMIPLSAYYFCRWPFGGAYANLIAIPLIGVVVQLGAIAGLLGLTPVIGPYIALVLSAANWLFTTFFLWLAHVFTIWFPYPFVRRPSEIEVLVYYVFVAAFIWHKPLWRWITSVCETRGWSHRYAPGLLACTMGMVAVLPLWLAPARDSRPPGLHVTVLSVGYGSSILIESPGGKKILVDTGYVEHERGRRNEADRTILPYLAHSDIHNLDALILTSPLPERSAGAAYIMEHLRVKHLIVSPLIARLLEAESKDEFVSALSAGVSPLYLNPQRIDSISNELVVNPQWPKRPSLSRALASRHDSFINRWAGWVVDRQTVKSGMILFEENIGGKSFGIEVVSPPSTVAWSENPVENNSLVIRVVYGEFAMLLPSALHYEGQKRLADAWSDDRLQSRIMFVPDHGAAIPGNMDRPTRTQVQHKLNMHMAPLMNRVNPEIVLFEFGSPRPVLGDQGRTAIDVHAITRQFLADRVGEEGILSTDRDMAIMIYSDGVDYQIDTQALRNRAEGGEDDAVSDISVGL